MPGETVTYGEGEQIYSPFTDRQEVFFIEFGYVTAFTFDESGKQRIHLIYGPGAYFPVITTFKNTEQRATYEALSKVIVKKFSRTEFLKKLETDNEFSNLVVRKTVDQLAIFADIVVNLQVTKLEDKLLGRLKNLAKAHGQKTTNGIKLPYKLKLHHMADMLGVERESVSRVLNSLKKQSLIDIDSHGYLLITDL